MTIQEIIVLIKQWQSEDKKVVLGTGTFDLSHPGHIDYFEKIRTYGDKVIIGINSDKFTRDRKGPDRPIINETDRMRQVASNRNVDAVFVALSGKWGLLKTLKPDVVVFNGTDTDKSYEKQQEEKLNNFKKEFPNINFVIYNQPRSIYSTSGLIKKIRQSASLAKQ